MGVVAEASLPDHMMSSVIIILSVCRDGNYRLSDCPGQVKLVSDMWKISMVFRWKSPRLFPQKAQEHMRMYLCNYWSHKNGSPIKIHRILPGNQPGYFGNYWFEQYFLKNVKVPGQVENRTGWKLFGQVIFSSTCPKDRQHFFVIFTPAFFVSCETVNF